MATQPVNMPLKENGTTGGHHTKPRGKHRQKHLWSTAGRRLRASFKSSFKEVEELKRETWSVIKQIPEILFTVFCFVATRLLFPVLQFGDFRRMVQYMFMTGWQEAISNTIIKVLRFINAPLELTGRSLEKWANYFDGGGYTSSTGAKLKLSIIGLLDKRVQLQKDTVQLFPSPTASARPNVDVCIMAAKIVYETEDVVADVINNVWNSQWTTGGDVQSIDPSLAPEERFEFVKWFSYTRREEGNTGDSVETQAMLFKRGDALVLAFRGTEPFSAVDWATDFYFPWWELPALGRVHKGFLQGLGLGFAPDKEHPKGKPQQQPPTGGPVASSDDALVAQKTKEEKDKLEEFSDYIAACMTRFRAVAERSTLTGTLSEEREKKFKKEEKQRKDRKEAFMTKYVLKPRQEDEEGQEDEVRDDAPLYWQIRAELLKHIENPDAHIFITGHSLGGALAALFTGLLAAESDEITQRISGLHTFGQPRVGDWTFAWFLHNRLNVPQHRYVRMVYGYDLVPHVPFDSDPFEFKHLGPFHWSNAKYRIKNGTFDEQPALSAPYAHLTAVYELLYNAVWSPIANKLFRPPPYKRAPESTYQILARFATLFFPMIGAHSPINYVNAVRHGMPEGKTSRSPSNAA